jgi:hypothetical protein
VSTNSRGLHKRCRDRGVAGDHPSHGWVCADQTWRVLVEDTHEGHLSQPACPRHEALARQDVIQQLVLSVVPSRPANVFGNELRHVKQSLSVLGIRPLECPGHVGCIVGTPWLAAWRTIQGLRCCRLWPVVQIAQDDDVTTSRRKARDGSRTLVASAARRSSAN